MSVRVLATRRWLDDALRRVYGKAWDVAPASLSGAVAAIVVSNFLALTLTLISLLASSEPLAVIGAVLTLLAIIILLDLALAAFLLRGSRLIWTVFVALHASAMALMPGEPWEVPGYLASLVVLVLLLAPTTIRTVWRRRPSRYAPTYQEVRRSD